MVVTVKALACERPARSQRPLARWSVSELAAATQQTGLVASISGSIPIWCLCTGPSMPVGSIKSEIYFSIVQRKVLTPNDFEALADMESRLLAFQRHYESLARPFKWTFTRRDLARLLALQHPPYFG